MQRIVLIVFWAKFVTFVRKYKEVTHHKIPAYFPNMYKSNNNKSHNKINHTRYNKVYEKRRNTGTN